MKKEPLKILMVEDSADDELVVTRELRRGGFDPRVTRVWNAATMRVALAGEEWDCILSDHQMPEFDVFQALEVVKASGLDIPFIIVSGAIGEENAVTAMRAGAHDFIDKNRMTRLNVAIRREMAEAVERLARRKAEKALKAKSEELVSMTQQLWQAAKLATMGELTASVAHELNNPLTTITLTIESILHRMPEGDPLRDAAEVIRAETNRMAGLVANLLHYSRRMAPRFAAVDVREELNTTIDMVRGHLRNHGVVTRMELGADVPMALADRQQLRQIFLNLITNAVDAMPSGGCLDIRVVPGDIEGLPGVGIEFKDSGVGIAPEVLPKVMDPFYTSKPEGKGTGLGLSICRRIVSEHQGELALTSKVGEGTTARVVLPVALGDA